MRFQLVRLNKKRATFIVMLFLSFFFSAQVSLTIYIDSSFLSQTIRNSTIASGNSMWNDPDHLVGALYTIASLFTILALMYVPTLLRKIGNYRATLGAVIIHMLMLLGLGVTNSVWFVIPMFIVSTTLTSVLYFNFDIFLERYSREQDTGKIRGLFMAFSSIAWLLPPLLAGYIAAGSGFQLVYLCGAMLLIPIILLIMRFLNHFEDMHYDDVSLVMTREEVKRNKNIYDALVANFFLHFFYAWMVIYSPIYLHNLGFTYDEVGLMIAIALSAFVIFPYPAGYIADKYIGEKELLIGGFVVMAGASFMVPLLGAAKVGVAVWALLLFISRMGASIVETMTETYYFKLINANNAGLIGYFRRTRPLAYVIAPIIASILLESGLLDIQDLFFVLAGIMLLALHFASALKDTK